MTINKHTILFAIKTRLDSFYSNRKTLETIQEYIIKKFGGYSITTMEGGWLDDKEVIEETSYKLELINENDTNDLLSLCKYIKKVALQDEIYLYTEKINLTKI